MHIWTCSQYYDGLLLWLVHRKYPANELHCYWIIVAIKYGRLSSDGLTLSVWTSNNNDSSHRLILWSQFCCLFGQTSNAKTQTQWTQTTNVEPKVDGDVPNGTLHFHSHPSPLGIHIKLLGSTKTSKCWPSSVHSLCIKHWCSGIHFRAIASLKNVTPEPEHASIKMCLVMIKAMPPLYSLPSDFCGI
jgi:hypothetical protein